MTLTKHELQEKIKTELAIKTSNKDQARQLVALLKGGGFGHWAIIWDDVKQGSIFSFIGGKMVIDRDVKLFEDRKIILFKTLKIKEE